MIYLFVHQKIKNNFKQNNQNKQDLSASRPARYRSSFHCDLEDSRAPDTWYWSASAAGSPNCS